MSKGVHVAHNKLEANLQGQHGQGGHGAIPLSAGMLLVTLGVVYGDIGTSPMYTMKSIVANNGGIGTVSEDMILGALSLVIWTMTLVTTVKYVVIAMKADNHNEGGIFALFSLVRKVAPWLILPAMIGGAALLADGILTPAVTVTTAIEGLRTIEWGHALLGDGQTNVIIITIIIICGLFAMQRAGTSSIGKLFGPLMTLWFLFLAGAGLFNMLGNLSILRALNPIRGIMFLFSPINHSGIMVLGFVFLSTTGAEALYSDMGHVGKANIYASWPFVKAALILNYLGQGAWLLANNSNPQMLAMDIVNPFYMMLPEPLRPFAIVLSAVAAIIALAGAHHRLVLAGIRGHASQPYAASAHPLPQRHQGSTLYSARQQHHVGRLYLHRAAVPKLRAHGKRLWPRHHRDYAHDHDAFDELYRRHPQAQAGRLRLCSAFWRHRALLLCLVPHHVL